jgi:hypothetical protein
MTGVQLATNPFNTSAKNRRSVSCTRAHLERMKMEERRGKKGWWPREKIDQ